MAHSNIFFSKILDAQINKRIKIKRPSGTLKIISFLNLTHRNILLTNEQPIQNIKNYYLLLFDVCNKISGLNAEASNFVRQLFPL